MERNEIKSSLLQSVGYDSATKILEVQFTRGSIYQYSNVEPEKAAEMLAAKSIGSFFLKEIKPNFPCKRMDGGEDATRKEKEDQTRPEGGSPDPEDVA